MKRLVMLILAVAGAGVPQLLGASPATRLELVVPNCYDGVCPFPNPPRTTVASREVLPLFVFAVDDSGGPDLTYRGTIVFGSSDSTATLPESYTFTAEDQGTHLFIGPTSLQMLGAQLISAQDTSGMAGSVTLTVLALGAGVSVPTLGLVGKAILAILIASAGLWVVQSRSS